jgi:regulator of nucleoside diphosphate kinase
MHKNLAGERLLTEIDSARLNKLRGEQFPSELADALASLELVPSREIPPDTVTMYSQVLVEDLASKKRQKLTLCYPADAEPHLGFISVLSPVGASLLGQSVGAIAHWRTPNGDACSAEIVSLLFQPEASGDFTT